MALAVSLKSIPNEMCIRDRLYVRGRQTPVGSESGHRSALRYPERAERRRCKMCIRDRSVTDLMKEDGSGKTRNRMNQAANRMIKMRLLLNSEVFIKDVYKRQKVFSCG